MTIAIVGGGLAAATAASELRASGHDGPVVVYAAEDHLPYERPPLSKGILLGRDGPEKATVHDLAWYRDNDVDLRMGTEVRTVRLDDHVLRTRDGEESFTKLLMATGALPRRLALADESGKPVVYLRTLEDSQRLVAAFADKPAITVIGGGWIGLEVTAAAREAGCAVTVYEMADLPLQGVLGSEVAQVFADLHRAHGVDLRLGTQVTGNDLAGADLVVVGIGAVPTTWLAEDAGLAVDNGVLVDAYLRASHPDVYAIGDVANHDHPVLGRIRVEHWDNAIQQAMVAARNLLGAQEPYERQPYFFTDQYDLGMEYFGNGAGYDDVVIEGDTSGPFRAFWLRDRTVIAAMHVNDWDASKEVRASVGKPYSTS
jgi:NADPH-dependent 2,4-dienoyl-CoA reductase/sulfur reductase-like enzyme